MKELNNESVTRAYTNFLVQCKERPSFSFDYTQYPIHRVEYEALPDMYKPYFLPTSNVKASEVTPSTTDSSPR